MASFAMILNYTRTHCPHITLKLVIDLEHPTPRVNEALFIIRTPATEEVFERVLEIHADFLIYTGEMVTVYGSTKETTVTPDMLESVFQKDPLCEKCYQMCDFTDGNIVCYDCDKNDIRIGRAVLNGRFVKALEKLPNYAVDQYNALFDHAAANDVRLERPTYSEARVVLTAKRFSNKSCDNCGDRCAKLLRCQCCHLVVYCSRQCQLKAWPRHKRWAKNLPHVEPEDIPEVDIYHPNLRYRDLKGRIVNVFVDKQLHVSQTIFTPRAYSIHKPCCDIDTMAVLQQAFLRHQI